MTVKRILVWFLALVMGFGIGLAYSWVISPAQQVDAEPRMLREDFKDDFRSAIAAAYFSNPDLERARARLELLGDPEPYQALSAQAQRMLAAGDHPDSVQKVALLASALQGATAVAGEPSPSEATVATSSPGQTGLPAGTEPGPLETTPAVVLETGTADAPEPAPGTGPTSTSAPALTATPRPTRTPTPTLGAPYQLVGEETVCEPDLEEGLLQVVVIDLARRQIPGAEIVITWNNGEEHIFTGLKPELGHGYADFLMTPETTYSVRMADGGMLASEISAPDCETTGGDPYLGGIRVTFQQP